MSLFKGKISKKSRKTGKKKSGVKAAKKTKLGKQRTNKFRITTEISLTGNNKNPLKSKMSGFFIKFSYKDDSKQNLKNELIEDNKTRKTKKIKNK